MIPNGWIGVDLDGTLAMYGEWVSETHIGPPCPPPPEGGPSMVERVKGWLADGHEVRIVTARISGLRTLAEIHPIKTAIQEWCLEHIGEALAVTNVKDYEMLELWDDRAVQVEPNTSRLIGRSTRGL